MKRTKLRARRYQALAAGLLAVALAVLPGCGKAKGSSQAGSQTKGKSGETLRVRVKDQQNQLLATFIMRPKLVRVEYFEDGNPRVLEAKVGGSVHRYWDGKTVLAEASRTDNQIRLRSADGKLLWTMILRGERVRLSPAAEGTESIWLSRADDSRLRVSRGKVTLARVTQDAQKKRVKIRDSVGNALYDAPSTRVEPWFGVLALQDLPWMERYLLAMELLAAER